MSNGLLLDTVVVSELRKGRRADASVISWQETVMAIPTYLSVVSLLEIRVGIRRVQQRDPDFATRLNVWYHGRLLKRFGEALLVVNKEVAELTAELLVSHGLSSNDALIAATARLHDLVLVTRNVSDFVATGIPIVNPWEHQSE